MSLKRTMRFLRWKMLGLLSEELRYATIRKMFFIDYDLPEDLIFKVANSKEEIEQALTILHDGFVDRDLMEKSESKMRITKYHSLPTTTILIVKKKDEVIGTVSVVRDSPLKLPTDGAWDLTHLRNKGLTLAEVSGLAIKKGYQGKNGRLLFALCRYMKDYAHHYAKADALVITTSEEVKDFYRAILLFRPIEGEKSKKYGFVKEDRAVAQWLPLTHLAEEYRSVYGNNEMEKNLHHYFFVHQFPNFKFPERKYHTVCDFAMNPQLMEDLFMKRSSVYLELSDKERMALNKLHFSEESKAFLSVEQDEIREKRFPVDCPMSFISRGKQFIVSNSKIEEVSRSGLRTSLQIPMNKGDVITLNAEIGTGKVTQLRAEVVWTREDKAGLRIVKASHDWHKFINYLEESVIRTTHLEAA